jgi:hypothetical protein
MGLFDFDAFALKDIWKGIKKDPERLLMGAVDPLSTKMWNGITGKDYEPLVDQMGGPYGGGWVSAFGKDQDGGVYKRAEEAGIDTSKGKSMHDGAHVLSAIFGGQGMFGAGQNLLGGLGQSGSNLGIFANNGVGGMSGVGGGNAGVLAQGGGISGGAGSLGSSMWPRLAGQMQSMPGMPSQQQQQEQREPLPYWINGRIVYL